MTLARSLSNRASETVSVRDYGAAGDGTTDDTAAIQAAIDATAALGTGTKTGGTVFFPPGEYVVSDALVLSSGVYLQGSGPDSTWIKKQTQGAAHWIIETVDFATLQDSNLWYDTDGVPSGFGIMDIAISGNGYPPVAATNRGGVRFYGRRYTVKNVVIAYTDGTGFHSSCALAGGQLAVSDMPEANIDHLMIYRAGSDGLYYEGPHDGHIKSVFISTCFNDGAVFDRTVATSGTCECDLIHTYANLRYGMRVNAPMHFGTVIAESNVDSGVVFEEADNTKIDWLQFYSNNNGLGTRQIDVTSNTSRLGIANVNGTGSLNAVASTQSEIFIDGDEVYMDNIHLVGNSATLNLIEVGTNATYIRLSGVLSAGDVGLKVTNGGFSRYDLAIREVTSKVLETSGDYLHSAFIIRGYTPTVTTVWDGYPLKTQRQNMSVDFVYKVGTDRYRSKNTVSDEGANIDIGTIGSYDIVLAHGIAYPPAPEEVNVNVEYTGAMAGWSMRGPYVVSTDATNVTLRAYVDTAIGVVTVQPIVNVLIDAS